MTIIVAMIKMTAMIIVTAVMVFRTSYHTSIDNAATATTITNITTIITMMWSAIVMGKQTACYAQ